MWEVSTNCLDEYSCKVVSQEVSGLNRGSTEATCFTLLGYSSTNF